MSEGLYVYLWGGLGNQLFQYAAGLAIQDALQQRGCHSQLFLLPAQDNGHSARDYRSGLMPFGQLADSSPKVDAQFWPQDGFAPWDPAAVASEIESRFKRLLVRGYFQTLPLIRSDLLARFAEVRRGLAVKYRLQATHTVASIHVRRGDYTKLKDKGFHLLGPEYYVPAIAAVQASAGPQGPPRRWLVFSDDPAWCGTQPWLPAGAEVVEEADEVATLLLLSLCQSAAITSNSTFSWWGGILAAPPVATYPARWIGAAKPNLFPAGWMRIYDQSR
jgi:hypothetical protein